MFTEVASGPNPATKVHSYEYLTTFIVVQLAFWSYQGYLFRFH